MRCLAEQLVSHGWAHTRNVVTVSCSRHMITCSQSWNVRLSPCPWVSAPAPLWPPPFLIPATFIVRVPQLPFSLPGTGRGLVGGGSGDLAGCSRPRGALILATAASCSGASLISRHHGEVSLLFGQLVQFLRRGRSGAITPFPRHASEWCCVVCFRHAWLGRTGEKDKRVGRKGGGFLGAFPQHGAFTRVTGANPCSLDSSS